jgi:hypothetical protein
MRPAEGEATGTTFGPAEGEATGATLAPLGPAEGEATGATFRPATAGPATFGRARTGVEPEHAPQPSAHAIVTADNRCRPRNRTVRGSYRWASATPRPWRPARCLKFRTSF